MGETVSRAAPRYLSSSRQNCGETTEGLWRICRSSHRTWSPAKRSYLSPVSSPPETGQILRIHTAPAFRLPPPRPPPADQNQTRPPQPPSTPPPHAPPSPRTVPCPLPLGLPVKLGHPPHPRRRKHQVYHLPERKVRVHRRVAAQPPHVLGEARRGAADAAAAAAAEAAHRRRGAPNGHDAHGGGGEGGGWVGGGGGGGRTEGNRDRIRLPDRRGQMSMVGRRRTAGARRQIDEHRRNECRLERRITDSMQVVR